MKKKTKLASKPKSKLKIENEIMTMPMDMKYKYRARIPEYNEIEANDLWEYVHKSLDNYKQSYILYFRIKLGMTLREIAPILGRGVERIRQIEAKALRRLRHPLRRRSLE